MRTPDPFSFAGPGKGQVIALSLAAGGAATDYEDAWSAINEFLRADHTWSGYERNNAYVNNGDGTFTEAACVLGLDFVEDGRSFALADLDGDGRFEVVLKTGTHRRCVCCSHASIHCRRPSPSRCRAREAKARPPRRVRHLLRASVVCRYPVQSGLQQQHPGGGQHQ